MRTEEQFKRAWDSLEWFIKFHKKSIWLVPVEDSYELSIIRPDAKDLPSGTKAILYDKDLHSVDSVLSTKTD